MDGTHRYEINLKKDDLFINLSSDDVYFISKQMDKWCRILLDDSYVPVALPKSIPVQESAPIPVYQAPPEQPAYQQPLPPAQPQPVYQAPPPPQQVAQPAPMPVAPHPPLPQEQPQPVYQQPEPVPVPQPVPVAAVVAPLPQAPPPPPQPVYAQPPAQAPVAQPVPQPAPQPVPASYPQPAAVSASLPALDEAVKDDFEAVMDSLMRDLEDPNEPLPVAAESNVQPSSFPDALPDMARGVPAAESLSELCDRSHAGSSEDYLLISAYYLTFFEQAAQFSLKRVNSALVKSGLTPINHSVLETSLARGYLSMVPDLTGMAEVTEYVLTEEGQQAAGRLL